MFMTGLKTPLLFLVFNRPEETSRVFEAIRRQKPAELFLAADGPRADIAGEADLVRETRAIISRVDWPCQVKTLFREKNLGCGRAVSEAISWFFSEVEAGIILEDDCLPHQDFFPYCETLLQRYRNDQRVATIAGTHFFPPSLPHQASHYASKYFQMWGWATWRRVWRHYDFNVEGPEQEWWHIFQRVHPIPVEAGYWREILRALRNGTIDTWDFQMFFMAWKQRAVHILPGKNLVSNIGYGPQATHTVFQSNMAGLPVHSLTVGPETVPLEPDTTIDNMIFYLRFLESLTQTWWLDQVLSPEQKLGQVRSELESARRQVRMLEKEVQEKRRQLRDATKALAQATTGITACAGAST